MLLICLCLYLIYDFKHYPVKTRMMKVCWGEEGKVVFNIGLLEFHVSHHTRYNTSQKLFIQFMQSFPSLTGTVYDWLKSYELIKWWIMTGCILPSGRVSMKRSWVWQRHGVSIIRVCSKGSIFCYYSIEDTENAIGVGSTVFSFQYYSDIIHKMNSFLRNKSENCIF